LFTHRADGDAGLASGRLDRCSRAAGVVGGLHQWQSRLGAYSRQPLERCQPGAPPEAAADLAVLVGRLAGLLGRARAATSWEALAGWLSAAASDLVRSSPARDQVLDAIGDLGRLATVEPLGELAPARRCGRLVAALEVVLDRPERSHGRFGCGPLVGALGAVCGVGAELTVVLGCVEGALPGHLGDDPLLPRHERDRVEGAEDVERADERDRRLIVSILHSSGRALASAPRTAPGGRSVMPSRWLDPSSLGGPTVSVPSFAAALERVASGADACADATEYELAGLLACRRSRHGVRHHFLLASGDISERLERARSRRRSGLSRFAGDLTAVARDLGANAIWDRPFSPTTLESLATCPFRFLADQLLRVVPLAAPEELDTIDARERGSLMHGILEEYFRPFVGAPAPLADIPAPQGPAGTGGGGAELPGFLGPAERARLLEIVDAHFGRLEQQGRTGRALFWKIERGRVRRDLERFVARELESAHRRRSRPVRLELSFGHERPLVIAAGGREVAFRGRMDRVDVEAGRDMVVIDYKSGSSVSYRSLLCDPLGAGRHLQLPIYAKAAAAVLGEPSTGSIRSEYRFISAEAAFEVAPVELNEEVATALTSTLSTLVGVVEAGTFPPNPGTLGDARPGRADSAGPNCQWCDYDGLCTTDRLELWRRARSDKRMSAYVELTESGGQTS
ncbi:MAG: PD-(D/E)XK nuclease family protein, partial [Acidimicrobiales bacterium]